MTLPDRLVEKIDASGPCWLWTAAIGRNGYGRFRFDGRWGLAHRAVYELLVGEIPDGMQLDHLCRVRHCVNPDHLEPVTCGENIRRGRGSRFTCRNGHQLDAENTYVWSDGARRCRACQLAAVKRYQSRQKAIKENNNQ